MAQKQLATQNGAKIDYYYNNYDPAKHYEELLFRDARPMMASEMNEMQAIELAWHKALGKSLYKDGDVISGCQIAINKSDGIVTATSGKVFLDGLIWDLPQARFQIATSGTVAVGARIVQETVSELEDPDLRNPAVGCESEGEAGAWRLKMTAEWGFDSDGKGGSFYPVYMVDDGEMRPKEAPPALDSFNVAIARYDRDSTGGGSYICDGMLVTVAPVTDRTTQIFYIAAGRARVNGEGAELLASYRIRRETTPDLRFVDTEVHTANGKPSQRINVAHAPVWEYVNLRVPTRKTITMTHGNFSGCQDALPDSAVLQIVEVRQGNVVFRPDVDYVRSGDKIDWAPGGNEPATGSSFQATYDFLNTNVEPKNADYDGFTVENAVAGSSIMISYQQALPRVDRLCLNPGGLFSFVTGLASEYGARAPQAPADSLALASIFQNWRGTPEVENDGVRVVPFSRMLAQDRRMDWIESQVARNRLEMDLGTREAGQRTGMLVDPFLDDSVRDQGLAQTAAIVGGCLTLAVKTPANMPALAGSVPKIPLALNYSAEERLSQTLVTGEMRVNPYMAFTAPEGKAEISPAIDRWTETRTDWASDITKTFYSYSNRTVNRSSTTSSWRNSGTFRSSSSSTSTTSSTTTENLGVNAENIPYLREIAISFTLSGFGPGEIFDKVNFGGVDVPFTAPKTFDANGRLAGSFRIPANTPAGIKQIEFKGRSGVAYATFVGEGTLEVTTLRRVQNIYSHTTTTTTVTTVRYYNPDPLAQTFTLETPGLLAGLDLWFKARGRSNAQIQIRETANGFPTAVVLASATLTPEAEKLDGPTRVFFDSPVPLEAGVEYAIVILCNDPDTAVAVAEMGKFDANVQKWVTAQPYTVGALLSSSNASTWTAHQTTDLAFRLLMARFTETERVVELGSIALPAGTTDLILAGLCEIPASSCRCEYELELQDGAKISLAPNQGASLDRAVSGTAKLRARLYGQASASPVLWPGTQIICGILQTEGIYVTRSVEARGAAKATLVYDAYIPAGASVSAEIQINNGAWTRLSSPATKQQGDGVVEYTYSQALANADLLKVRLTLTGTPKARPEVYDLRLLTSI